jgi:uncharacterized RDD family membrane protein YckC
MITLDTLAWKSGMSDWQPVRHVPEIVTAFPHIQVASPRNIQSTGPATRAQRYADFGPRFVAGLLDGLILIIPALIVSMLIPVIGGFLVSLAYYGYYMSENGGGQTIGYKTAKIKLVHEVTGQPLALSSTFLWWLVLSVAAIIGWIWFFTDDKRRMLHNIASKSVVVKL